VFSLRFGKSALVETKPTSIEGNYAKADFVIICLQKAGHHESHGYLENKVPTC